MKIAIDGPAGSGKSTVAKLVAKRLGFNYIDTGAMYRALGWKSVNMGIELTDIESLSSMLEDTRFSFNKGKLCLDGRILGEEIRTQKMSKMASDISKLKVIRDYLTTEQRFLAENSDVVMEGRDIGTVVLPDAKLKVFLTASPEERARRRLLQLEKMGKKSDYDEILNSIIDRDKNDSTRELAPLKPADDAIILDTTGMSIDEVIDSIVQKVDTK